MAQVVSVELAQNELGLLLEALDKAQLSGRELRKFVSQVEAKLIAAQAELSKPHPEDDKSE